MDFCGVRSQVTSEKAKHQVSLVMVAVDSGERLLSCNIHPSNIY